MGIIPGRREPRNIDPYLELLVEDILDLPSQTIYDSYKDEKFTPQSSIILHVLDYPGQNKVFHCTGKFMYEAFSLKFVVVHLGAGSYSGCVYCCVKGEYSSHLRKMEDI